MDHRINKGDSGTVKKTASTAATEQQGVCAGDKKSPAPISIDRAFNFLEVEFSLGACQKHFLTSSAGLHAVPLSGKQGERTMEPVLEVRHLTVQFHTPSGTVQAVRDVSFSLHKGEVLAIVGESGCGKSVLCRSILKLLPDTARLPSGTILVNGVDITGYWPPPFPRCWPSSSVRPAVWLPSGWIRC